VKAGLIGLPQSGKTTVFNALTKLNMDVKGYSQDKIESHLGVVKVPDERVDYLDSVYKPKKVSYAEMAFVDIGCKKKDDGRSEFDLQAIKELDMLAVVIRAFKSAQVIHPSGNVDPLRDLNNLLSEFILEDLALVEKRIEKIDAELKRNKKENIKELEYLKQFKDCLEEEKPIRLIEFDEEMNKLFRGFQFLSQKPVIIVFNTGESESDTADTGPAQDKLDRNGIMHIKFCGKLEMEISQLSDEDREIFLEELNIKEPALNLFIRSAYKLLNRIEFFTVGPDEVKAWEIPSEINAKEAAGKIHSDIARGFIRAEVLAYKDFVDSGNSYVTARSKGLVRLEGKEYKVKDGDIIEFRFNV